MSIIWLVTQDSCNNNSHSRYFVCMTCNNTPRLCYILMVCQLYTLYVHIPLQGDSHTVCMTVTCWAWWGQRKGSQRIWSLLGVPGTMPWTSIHRWSQCKSECCDVCRHASACVAVKPVHNTCNAQGDLLVVKKLEASISAQKQFHACRSGICTDFSTGKANLQATQHHNCSAVCTSVNVVNTLMLCGVTRGVWWAQT